MWTKDDATIRMGKTTSVSCLTPLPVSAARERLFSIAGLVFSPRRARLDSRSFENQPLLKMNRKFFK
jgi:hypothetical protein